MKKFNHLCLAVLFFLAPMAHPAPSHYACHEIVYYAKTHNHKKELLVCLSGPYLTVTYGGIYTQNADLDFSTVSQNVSWFRDKSEKGAYSVGLSIRHNAYQYIIYGFMFNDTFQANLTVCRHDVSISTIALDPRSVINTIDNHLNAQGLLEHTPFKP